MSHFPVAAMQRLLAPASIAGPGEAVQNIIAARLRSVFPVGSGVNGQTTHDPVDGCRDRSVWADRAKSLEVTVQRFEQLRDSYRASRRVGEDDRQDVPEAIGDRVDRVDDGFRLVHVPSQEKSYSVAAAEARQAGAVRPGVAEFSIGDHVAVAGDNVAGVAIGHTGIVRHVWSSVRMKGLFYFVVEIDGSDCYDLPVFTAPELMALEPFETARAS